MKSGLSSAVFYPQKAEDAVKKVVEMKFSSAEYFFNCEYEISKEFADELKSIIAGNGTKIISVHPFTAFAEAVFFFSEYERRTAEQIKKYCEIFKTVKSIGADYFTFHGDRAYKGLSDDECVLKDFQLKSLKTLADAAESEGITLCLENVCWCKSANLNYLRKISENIENIGFTLDLKQARRADISVYDYVSVMGNRIKNIHISDFSDNHDCLLPGEGEFDFKKFFECIRDIGYKGDVITEVYSSGYAEESQILKSKEFTDGILKEI